MCIWRLSSIFDLGLCVFDRPIRIQHFTPCARAVDRQALGTRLGGHMSANMISNLCQVLKGLPVVSMTSWMDNTSALYWIVNPGKQWNTFALNRVSKFAKISEGHQINWKHCPSEMNIADLSTRGASLDKMERGNWYEGPKWLSNESDWPDQPVLKSTSQVNEDAKKLTDVIANTSERKPDEWDNLSDRKSYWKTLIITS